MPTTPYASFRVGAVTQPLPSGAAAVQSLLQDADPAIFYLIEFFSFVINTYPGPRLLTAAEASNLTNVTSAVALAIPYDPTPWLSQAQFGLFPLLTVFRVSGATGRKTAGWEHDRGRFELTYSLPPLTAAQMETVGPILNAVAKALRAKTTQGFDPGYTPTAPTGVTTYAGMSPFLPGNAGTPTLAGTEAVGFGDPTRDPAEHVQYGRMAGTGEIWMPTLRMSGYIVERDQYVSPGGVSATGVDVDLALVAPDQTVLDDFVQLSSQEAPTVTSLSVASGSHLGGTSVTITGTLFLQGPPTVLFGNVPATNVVWNSATSLTCAAPAVGGASAKPLGVTVVNRDGQAGSLPGAYTYT